MRSAAVALAVPGLLCLGMAVSGCGATGANEPAASRSTAGATAAVTSSRATSPSANPSATPAGTTPMPAPTASTDEPEAGDGRLDPPPETLSVPAETAGALDASDVPAPPDLGPGWRRYVDPGEAEDGYAGNGSWVRARGGAEVVQAVVPLGCSGLTSTPRLPVPRHALEATYRGPGGAPAVALVFDYARSSQAAAFLRLLGDVGRACPEPPSPVGPGDPMVAVVTQTRADSTTILDRRREYGVGASKWVWSEAVVRRGDRVGLLSVASAADLPAPNLDALERSVRASVDRLRQ